MTTLERDELAEISAKVGAYFADPSQFSDPYPVFARLRELEPVHWHEGYGVWVITGFPEAEEALHHPALAREASAEQQFRSLGVRDVDAADVVEAIDILLSSILNRDPPAHTRLRKLVSRAFTPRAVSAWEPRIQATIDALVDTMVDRQEFDFLHDLAFPLPQSVICELIGVPLEDLNRTQGLSHTRIMTVRANDEAPVAPGDLRALTQQGLVQQVAYWRGLIAERKLDPGDDLISLLIKAEEEGDRLSMNELIGSIMIIIGAGFETTANLVTNGMFALLSNREQFELLKRDRSLLPNAMEEILRHESPSRGQPRVASADMVVGGREIKAGQLVQVLLNACNRDPRVNDDPERFDITRTNIRHITFTAGPHYCLGASLAKLEAGMMFGAVLDRFGDLELAIEPAEVRWKPAYVRGVESLPVRRRSS